MVNRW